MTAKNTKEKRSPDRSSSENTLIEIYLFACGHGDTILIRLPDERWVLVDCYLPKRGGVRKQFFDFIEEKNIQQLAFVCQTHPDYDHFFGMHDVLTHFIEEDGKSVKLYCDSGLDAQQIKRLIVEPKRPRSDEFCRLQKSLREWEKQGKIVRREIDAERPQPIVSPEGYRGQIDFIPLGPDPKTKRRLTEASLETYGKKPSATLEANALSIVLALAVNDGKTKFNVLLSADADNDGIKRAVELWENHAREREISNCFDVIKLSHHGSIKNHYPELCEFGSDEKPSKVAAVSAGERNALPDRQVLEDYIDSGWTVMVTTVRQQLATDRAVDLHFDRGGTPSFQRNTIMLAWDRDGSFSHFPIEAVVERADLTAYDSAMT